MCLNVPLDVEGIPAGCRVPLETFGRLYYEQGALVLASMAIVPLVVGLLVGVPIVGREIEAGTTLFAWGVAPSRLRWFGRKVAVIGLVLGIVLVLAAVTSDFLETTRRTVMPATPYENFGLFGAVVALRGFAAFACGLLVGALTGRTLPAFILAALLMACCISLAGGLREYWASSQPQVVVDEGMGPAFAGQITGAGWIDESGVVLRYEDGIARVPPSGLDDPDAWLWGNGYRQISLGIARDQAEAWVPIEYVGWIALGTVFMGAAGAVTLRRHP
jgi:hypothetical protein